MFDISNCIKTLFDLWLSKDFVRYDSENNCLMDFGVDGWLIMKNESCLWFEKWEQSQGRFLSSPVCVWFGAGCFTVLHALPSGAHRDYPQGFIRSIEVIMYIVSLLPSLLILGLVSSCISWARVMHICQGWARPVWLRVRRLEKPATVGSPSFLSQIEIGCQNGEDENISVRPANSSCRTRCNLPQNSFLGSNRTEILIKLSYTVALL